MKRSSSGLFALHALITQPDVFDAGQILCRRRRHTSDLQGRLEQAGIVSSSRAGRESRFIYVPEPVEGVRSYLDTVCRQWDATLSRLKSFVEDSPLD